MIKKASCHLHIVHYFLSMLCLAIIQSIIQALVHVHIHIQQAGDLMIHTCYFETSISHNSSHAKPSPLPQASTPDHPK